MLPRTELQLIEVIRSLVAEIPTSPAAQKEHADRCFSLSMHLAKSGEYSGDVPHIIWHFLSDADIRAKSPEYAVAQRGEVQDLVASWAQDVRA
jgi:hypothetical protein